MKIQKTKTPAYKRRLFWAIIIVAVLIIGGTTYAFVLKQAKNDSSIRPVNSVDYSPPTDEEKTETEAFKDEQQTKDTDEQPINETGKVVTPIISYIGQYDASVEASAYIPSILEDNGMCTLTLKKGSSVITKTSKAVKDAQTTRCELFTFAAKELSSGTWSATIRYNSPTAQGSSSAMEFVVK